MGSLAAPLVVLAALAGCARGPQAPSPPTPGDRLEARVNGEPVWTSDVAQEAWRLGLAGRGEGLRRDDPRFRQALDERIDELLLAREAARRGLDRAPVAQRQLAAARERLLGDLVLNEAVNQAANESRIRKVYQDLAGAQPNSTKPSLDVLRPRIVRFLSYQAVKDLVLTLRQAARIEAPRTTSPRRWRPAPARPTLEPSARRLGAKSAR